MTTKKRAPRTSALSGMSAIRPPQPETQPLAAPAPSPAPAAAEAAAPKQPAPRRQAASTASKQQKVGFYQHPEDAARMRGAFHMTSGLENDRSLSDFIQKAIMVEVERREALYNNGEPFAAMQPGEGKVGRPEGS